MLKGKKYISSMLLMGVLCALVGCNGTPSSKQTDNEVDTPVVTASQNTESSKVDDNGDKTVATSGTKDESNKQNNNYQDVEDAPEVSESVQEYTELSIYCVDDDYSEKDSVMVAVPSDTEITARVITDAVVSEFQDRNIEIGIDDVTVDGGTVVVSFCSDKAPVTDVGAGIESLILDCISQSILDNLSSCKEIIFRIEGEAYESGHLMFEYDQPYLWN